jgi:hypothetical protein
MKRILFAAALLILGCNKGEGVIVVAVGATPPITQVSSLHVTMTVGKTTHAREVKPPSSTIANAADTSFSINAPAGEGPMSLRVDANDVAAKLLATGTQSGVAILAGKRTDVTIVLTTNAQAATVCLFDDAKSLFDHCLFAQ